MPRKTPCIVITGANGFVGSALTNHFASQGWQVRALVRDAAKYKKRKNVTYFDYDILAEVPDAAFKGATYLVHAAYVKGKPEEQSTDPNIAGAKRLLACSRKHHLQKNIFLSSMSADAKAVAAYGRQKFTIEKLFSRAEDVSLRCGLVIGNGGLIQQIVTFMRSKHIAPVIDGGEQPLQVIAVHDLVRVVSQVITVNATGILNIGTPEVYTYREFYAAIRRKLGAKAVIVPVPFWLPLFAIRAVNALHLPLQITEDNLWGLKKLRAYETLPDLAKLNLTVDNLEAILDNPNLRL